jgi:hypothetical protein
MNLFSQEIKKVNILNAKIIYDNNIPFLYYKAEYNNTIIEIPKINLQQIGISVHEDFPHYLKKLSFDIEPINDKYFNIYLDNKYKINDELELNVDTLTIKVHEKFIVKKMEISNSCLSSKNQLSYYLTDLSGKISIKLTEEEIDKFLIKKI